MGYCPAGTWSSNFQATSCNVCPVGQWTFSEGAQHEADCTPCSGSRYCLGGATGRVTIQVLNVDAEHLQGAVSMHLRSAYAQAIALALNMAGDSVVDLFGRKASSTLSATVFAGKTGLKISSFVTVPAGSSANAMAERLYTQALRSSIVKTTEGTLREHGSQSLSLGGVNVGAVAIKLEPFHPLQETTTLTTSTQTTSTGTLTETTETTTTRSRHLDISTSARAEWSPMSTAVRPLLSLGALLACASLTAGFL